MSKIQQVIDYLSFLVRSNNSHGIHSPFVFNLYNDVLDVKKDYYFFGPIESLRASYLSNEHQITMQDLGAGSALGKASHRKVSAIASSSLQSPKNAALLFRLVDYFQPESIIELGTSLGITTCYLSKASKKSRIVTIEGNPELARLAQEGFKKMALKNVQCKTGSFEALLPKTLQEFKRIDMLIFDGNHRLEPTLKYFNEALKFAHEQSLFIFDDIYWSAEMKQAWQQIKDHAQVTITIDLFDMGLVFFKQGQRKQHFSLRV